MSKGAKGLFQFCHGVRSARPQQQTQRRIPNTRFPPGVTDHLFLLSWIFWKMLLPLHFSFL